MCSSYSLIVVLWAIVATASATSQPAIFWSTTELATASSKQISSEQMEAMLFGEDQSGASKSNSAPEIIFIAVEPQLLPGQIKLLPMTPASLLQSVTPMPNLFSLLKTSTSSAVQYVSIDSLSATNSLITSLVDRLLPTGANVMFVKENDSPLFEVLSTKRGVKNLSLGSFKLTAPTDDFAKLLNNGVTDLIVLCFADVTRMESVSQQDLLTAHDETVGFLTNILKSTGYVGLYIVDRTAMLSKRATPSTNGDPNGVHGNVATIFVIMIPCFIILILGIYCLFSVQSGSQMKPDEKKKQ